MISIILSVIGAVLAIIHLCIDTFFSEKKIFKLIAVKILFLITIISLTAAFYSYNEFLESQLSDQEKKIQILELQKMGLEQEKQILIHKNTILSISNDLESEKKKIKSIAATIRISFENTWPSDQKPFQHNAFTVHVPYQDIPIIEAFPSNGPNLRPIAFYPSKIFSFYENVSHVIFECDLSLKGDADLLGASKNTLLDLKHWRVRLPLLLWRSQQIKYPIHINSLSITFRVNDNDIIEIEKPIKMHFYQGMEELPYNAIDRYYLSHAMQVLKKDYKEKKKIDRK